MSVARTLQVLVNRDRARRIVQRGAERPERAASGTVADSFGYTSTSYLIASAGPLSEEVVQENWTSPSFPSREKSRETGKIPDTSDGGDWSLRKCGVPREKSYQSGVTLPALAARYRQS